MSKVVLRISQAAVDCLVLALAFFCAFIIRFDGVPPAPMVGRLLLTGPYVIVLEYAMLILLGVHRFSWRYVGLKEVVRIALALAAATAVLTLVRLVIGEAQFTFAYLRHGVVPLGALGINAALAFLGVAGVRVARRLIGEHKELGKRQREHAHQAPSIRTLLIGAGQGGVLVARELLGRPDLGILPVGFVDDDERKVGSVIQGVPVLGTTAQLGKLRDEAKAAQALITMSNVSGNVIRRLHSLCDQAGLAVKMVPGLYEIIGGRVNLSRIREVAIEDLLRREPVALDVSAIEGYIHDRVVLVTGAGGSIGSELCRQVCKYGPAALVLFERSENNLFEIHRELSAVFSGVKLVPCIGDICDVARVEEIFEQYGPAVVLHAAAYKHVPMVEWNPSEGVKNNIFGSRVVADAAHRYRVDVFVMVSTDKAVNPTSIMGTTKRAAEMYIRALSRVSETRFVTVRFGNVLDSAGSVVPIFREQIARGGPLTVTHPDMRRYFMTIPEACQLILQAASMGEGGEIFILDMGEPIKILDLARDLILLSGLRPEDIEIVFTGVRPGEKLFEELSTDAETATATRHPKIFIGRFPEVQLAQLRVSLEELESSLATDAGALRQALKGLVPEYAFPQEQERLPVASVPSPNAE